MGLGKTVMTISLLLTHSERGGSSRNLHTTQSQFCGENIEARKSSRRSSSHATKVPKYLSKQTNTLASGGNLIICPMTLLAQWKVCIFLIGCVSS